MFLVKGSIYLPLHLAYLSISLPPFLLVNRCHLQTGLMQYYNQGKNPSLVQPDPLDLVLETTAKADGTLYCRFTRSGRHLFLLAVSFQC
jgi:hypothetical protein